MSNPFIVPTIELLGGRKLGTFDLARTWWQIGHLRLEVAMPRELPDGTTETKLYSIYTSRTAYLTSKDTQKKVEDEIMRILYLPPR